MKETNPSSAIKHSSKSKKEKAHPNLTLADVIISKSLQRSDTILLCVLLGLASNKKGCFATNAYLCQRCSLKIFAIKASIGRLEKNGIIKRQLDNAGDNSCRRFIFINPEYFPYYRKYWPF